MTGVAADPLTVGQCATLACLFEATAAKPGNVYRGADFTDLTYVDLLVSGVLIAPHLEAAAEGQPLGRVILNCIRATQQSTGTNSNLGMVLLLAPLAAATRFGNWQRGVREVLSHLTAEDARQVYEAIRLARPGGLGKVDADDVHVAAPDDLLNAMAQAADRDLVARQYANDFIEVFKHVVPCLLSGIERGWSLHDTIVWAYLKTMSEFPDSLIARKCGQTVAVQSAGRAARAIGSGLPGDEAYHEQVADLDFWLRSDGHRRNPGTSADLVCAGLFVALRDRVIPRPFTWSPLG